MAGHSKFKNIMHRKGAQDKRRAQLFTKIAREIQAAVKGGGADADANPRLRAAMLWAREENMPKDNVQRAVDRGAGAGAEDLVEIRYEGFAPGGVGVIVEALTDNKNRTAAEVRAAFAKNGGALGETNAVAFLWDRVGEVRYPLEAAEEDAMLEAAIEAGADDCAVEGQEHVVSCAVSALAAAAGALTARFGDPAAAKIVWRPQTAVPVTGEPAQALVKLIGFLEELDDVQQVYSNADFDEAELERLAG
jgi:YebC/PmpR family DNA-binding regulatory protein